MYLKKILADIETKKDWRIKRALYLFRDRMIFFKEIGFLHFQFICCGEKFAHLTLNPRKLCVFTRVFTRRIVVRKKKTNYVKP